MKRILFIFFLMTFVFVSYITLAQEKVDINYQKLENWTQILLNKKDISFLPNSPLYFLKEWKRGIVKFFTFDPVKKAELELKESDEKLVEAQQLVIKGKSSPALTEALNNYLQAQERLTNRLQSLPENKNTEELLNKLSERVILHQALLDEIAANNPDLEKAIIEGNKTVGTGQITEIIKRTGDKDNESDDQDQSQTMRGKGLKKKYSESVFTTRIEQLPYPEGVRELKALEILTRLEGELPEEAKKGIQTAKEAIQKQLIETGDIQQATNWKVKQGSSGWYKIEGVPITVKVIETVVKDLEEKAKEVNLVSQKPNIVNIEAIKELKIKIQEAPKFTDNKDDNAGETEEKLDQGAGDYFPTASEFKLEINGAIQGVFKEVNGVESDTEVVEYQDSDDIILRKRPGKVKISNIVLKRGYEVSPKLKEWYEKTVRGVTERKSISIIVLDRAGQEVGRYNLFESWPVKWKNFQLDVNGADAVEELEFAFEEMIVGKKIRETSRSVCPLIAPNISKGKEECLKAAKELEAKYPGCKYSDICETDQSYQKKIEDIKNCGPVPGAPGTWKCIDDAWIDISKCGKIQCIRYDPVCGTDGKTYSCGEADALSCGAKVAYKGECKKEEYPPSSESKESSSEETKLTPIPTTKSPESIFCTQEWNPVCGNDNKTYSNECMAKAAGVITQYKGECR